MNIIQAIERGVFVLDGAMGSGTHSMDLDISTDYLGRQNCTDILSRSRPDVIHEIHKSFLHAGADAVETNTFGANKLALSDFDDELASWAYELNRDAANIAREACGEVEGSKYVLGSIGPGTKLISLGQTNWEEMLDSYYMQASGLLEGGVDAFLIETCQDLLQVKCAINACLKALDSSGKSSQEIPIMVSVTIESSGTMLIGSDMASIVNALKPFPIFSLGLNCATGPKEMTIHIEYLSNNWSTNISCVPNAGLPVLVDGKTEFPLLPAPFSESVSSFVEEFGVDIVGGCCGTSTEHIKQLSELVRTKQKSRRDFSGWVPGCSSLYSTSNYRQEQSFFIVGERMNASGSRKFKRLSADRDYDEIISLAKQQVREGANCLDINVDSTGRDNAEDMAELVKQVVRQVDSPLMLDSTQLKTIEAGLSMAGGKCIINSTNFEEGVEKFDSFCQLAKKYGAGLVIGTIDEHDDEPMARTASRKFEIANRAIDRATIIHSIPIEDIFIDPLVLPISTGMDDDRRSSLELIEGVKEISSKWPQIQITCGLSNCSFGLKPSARQVLNSVLLWELMEVGLTSAIVHASKIQPMNRIHRDKKQAALDLIYDRRTLSKGGTGLPVHIKDEAFDPLQAFVDLFDESDESIEEIALENLSIEETLQLHIVDGEKKNLIEHLNEAMKKYSPLEIINDYLLTGMKTVGELFGSGQMQLPFVLQSAEVMKMSVSHLETKMKKGDEHAKGRIVLATVKGDVHDIGKNLVDIILSNNGWSVHNIGIKQPIEDIVQAWREVGADAIGMSGLLVKSVMIMEENLKTLNDMDINVPILLGGAPLSRHYCESHLRSLYDGPLYYGRDAFEGLRICNAISQGKEDAIVAEIDRRLAKRAAVETRVRTMETAALDTESALETIEGRSCKVSSDIEVLSPPFWGDRVVEEIPIETIYQYINKTTLFRGQWGFRKGQRSKGDYEHFLDEEVRPIFERLKKTLKEDVVLQPKVVYGWYPVASDGNDLIIYDFDNLDEEVNRFTFPRQSRKNRLCISDFFKAVETGEKDVLGLSCVTMGSRISEVTQELFDSNQYQEYLYVHGMGVECAEALAELWHKRMREELGINSQDSPHIKELFKQNYRGSRYSFGYPACPEMSDQEKLFDLLKPSRIGCELTENWQIDPEQSTSAIIVHHPQAKYFNAK